MDSTKTGATIRAMRRFLCLVLCALAGLGVGGCAGIRPPGGVPPMIRTLTTTGYCECKLCCGWKRNWLGQPVYAYGPNKGKRKLVGLTASGTYARYGTIAADTRLYPFGTVIYIEGYGYGRVEDRGGSIKGDHIDLFFLSHRAAQQWGRRQVRAAVWRP